MTHPVEFPTYEDHIQHLFTAKDIACMVGRSVDLASFEGVRAKAPRILSWVKSGRMPPPSENRTWSDEQVETFENWIDNGFQKVRAYPISPSPDARVRKDLHDLSQDEIDLLKKAFTGLRNRDFDITDKYSLFNLAGIHWYPGPDEYVHCRHHENEYNPWHRAYLMAFEDALRSVKDCEQVTLPFWNILGDALPDWIYEEPFYPYAYAHDLMDYSGKTVHKKKNDPIERYAANNIRTRVFARTTQIPQTISFAMSAPTWEKYNGWSGVIALHNAIIEAHDNGHGVCGPTIASPATAAFDPLFWFFHCNWDRLWWQWQTSNGATTLESFKSTLEEEDSWLGDKVGNQLKPFNVRSFEMIDLSVWNVSYGPEVEDTTEEFEPFVLASGRAFGQKAFKISSLDTLSVRVKNINRLAIPGSFQVNLKVDDTIIRSTRVFQPDEVALCDNCQKKGIFSKDFLVDREEVPAGAELKVEIRRILSDGDYENVPLSEAGNPTVNVRLLLEQDVR